MASGPRGARGACPGGTEPAVRLAGGAALDQPAAWSRLAERPRPGGPRGAGQCGGLRPRADTNAARHRVPAHAGTYEIAVVFVAWRSRWRTNQDDPAWDEACGFGVGLMDE